MGREDLVDDEVVLTYAKRLMLDGVYPTGTAVIKAMNYRWTDSAAGDSLRRLRASGRLVVPEGLKSNQGHHPEAELSPTEVDKMARLVRYEGRVQPTAKAPETIETITAWLSRMYWVPGRKEWYRRATCR